MRAFLQSSEIEARMQMDADLLGCANTITHSLSLSLLRESTHVVICAGPAHEPFDT
jgi:hypothetical protein